MFKKIFLSTIFLFSLLFTNESFACNGTSFNALIAGNTASFTPVLPVGYVANNYYWTFGDGGSSTLPTPTHTYANNGGYNVCLTVSGYTANNQLFQCNYCDSISIMNINPVPCNASFISTVAGNTAAFTNMAAGPGPITNYNWTFGDGGTSNLPNPTHSYATSGWYNVCLTIIGIDNNNVTYTCNWCDSIYVQVPGGNPCNGVGYTLSQVGNTVNFTPVVPVGYVVNTYYWTFGDGGTANISNPSHTYANFGYYTACMTVSGYNANNVPFQCTYCDSLYIPNNNPNPCNMVSYTQAQVGNTVTFVPVVPVGFVVNTYAWVFGDGGTSNLASPTHTYAIVGAYNACVTITGVYNNTIYTCTFCDTVSILNNNPNPCNASFISTVAGNTAAFTNTATGPGPITNYNWTFGDGGTSNLPNPTHTYATSGWYNVCLQIIGIDSNQVTYTCTWCDSIYVQVPGGNPCNGVGYNITQAGNTVTFIPSLPPGYVANTYYWTFGDGGTSNLASPAHTYANFGWYNACMVVSGVTANNVPFQCTYCDSLYIANNNPNPCNMISYTQTQVGNTVTFVPVLPPGFVANAYTWAFGDGGTSNLASPTHTYAMLGTYNACLIVTGIYNNTIYTCTYCDSVNIFNNNPNPCNASFISTVSGNTAAFTNTATGPGPITNYNWTFGDGGTSNLPNPTHTYATSGWYNVCLQIIGIDSNQVTYTCTWCDSIYVQVPGGNPCNGIYFIPNQTGNVVNFTAVLPAGYTANTYYWTFGDGGNSNAANPTHTYAANGLFSVCLVVSGTTANNTPFQCSVCDSIQVAGAGLNDVNKSNLLNIYPNPSTNYVDIMMPEHKNYTLRLYDVAGKLLDESSITNQGDKYRLHTAHLSKGMYFIQLVSDNKKYQTNFVKE